MTDKIIFTKHAVLKLQQRDIKKEFVIKTIQKPDSISLENLKCYAYKRFNKKYLKVIFKKTNETILVITQHWVKKI